MEKFKRRERAEVKRRERAEVKPVSRHQERSDHGPRVARPGPGYHQFRATPGTPGAADVRTCQEGEPHVLPKLDVCIREEEGGGQVQGLPDTLTDPPGTQPPRPQAHEHGADQLPKGGRVHGVQLVFLAVAKVVVVERTSGETHAFCGFVIIQEPLELDGQDRPDADVDAPTATHAFRPQTRRGNSPLLSPIQVQFGARSLLNSFFSLAYLCLRFLAKLSGSLT